MRQHNLIRALTTVPVLIACLAWPAAGTAAVTDTCMDCHGKDGASTESDVPIIGGMSLAYLSDSMVAYQKKERPCPESKYRAGDKNRAPTDMCKIATALSAADVKEAAAYFSSRPFMRATQQSDAAKAALGKKLHDLHCEKCHGDGGSSTEDDAGVLAGQWMPYLKLTFEDFKSGKRAMPEKMKPKFDPLKPEEVEALIQYYGSQH